MANEPTSSPSPGWNAEAQSTQTLSPVPTVSTRVTTAGVNSKLATPSPPPPIIPRFFRYAASSLGSAASSVRRTTPSTPVSSASNIASASLAVSDTENSRLSSVAPNLATRFSAGIILHVDESTTTRGSTPAILAMSSTSSGPVTSQVIPTAR